MKSWEHFREDVQSYARDKEAYERATESQSKLEARRRLAKKRVKNANKFTKEKQQKYSSLKKKLEDQKSDYESKSARLDAVKQRERQSSNKTIRQGAAMFNAGAKAVKKTASLIRNRIRNRQNSN